MRIAVWFPSPGCTPAGSEMVRRARGSREEGKREQEKMSSTALENTLSSTHQDHIVKEVKLSFNKENLIYGH